MVHHGMNMLRMIHIWSCTMHLIWSALYTTLSTNIRISASAWKNWFQIVVGIKLTEINHMLEKVGEIFTYYQMEKVGESWTQSNVDLLVEVSLVEPSLHVVAVHQHPPLLRQEVGNHLAQRNTCISPSSKKIFPSNCFLLPIQYNVYHLARTKWIFLSPSCLAALPGRSISTLAQWVSQCHFRGCS